MASSPETQTEPDDLQETWLKAQDLWNKYGGMALTVLVVVAAVVLGYRIYSARERQRHENTWNELASATSPGTLKSVAAGSDEPAVRALAFLRAGELLLSKATVPDAQTVLAATQPATRMDPNEVAGNLSQAAEMFNAAAGEPGAPTLVKLNAMLGLASVAEVGGAWDEADKIYDKVISEAKAGEWNSIAALATGAKATLGRLKDPIIFAPEAAIAPPTTQPAPAASSDGALSPSMIAEPIAPAPQP